MMKQWTAITTCADTGPLESLAQMLNSIGIGLMVPNDNLRDQLQRWGLDTILNPTALQENMGYAPTHPIPFANLRDLDRDDILFVDVKAHRNGPRLWRHRPHLKGRTLWYRINGGKPEHVVNDRGDHGDEVNPPCPILTPNLWYKQEFEEVRCGKCTGVDVKPAAKRCEGCDGEGSVSYQWAKANCVKSGGRQVFIADGTWYYVTGEGKEIGFKTVGGPCSACKGSGIASEPSCQECGGRGTLSVRMPWQGKSFACWPPFARLDEYDPQRRPGNGIDKYYKKYSNPLCLIHNLQGWGYGKTLEPMRGLGVRVHGQGSPDGLLQHGEARVRLETALAMVHLKSSDAPGYAIYEALASGCPLICPRRLIWRNRMHDLLVEGETCLCFDRETHDSLTDEEAASCTAEVAGHLRALSNHDFNQKIGNAGRKRLEEVMWSSKKESDVSSLRDFMERNFP